MPDAITVRTPRLALSERTPRYWFDGDPFLTHFLNALSSTFPDGEAFFVRSVQRYRSRVEGPAQAEAVRRFCRQEGLHSRHHTLHQGLLDGQGYGGLEGINREARREMRFLNRHLPLYSLALTAALEHLTAILARQILGFPERWAAPMHPDMRPLWRWHALEEAEHKAVAFDLYQRVSGSYRLRVVAGISATLGLFMDALLRTGYLLAKDGLLLRPGVWWRGLRRLAAPGPWRRRLGADYRAWYRRGFHPGDIDDRALVAAADAQLRAEGHLAA